LAPVGRGSKGATMPCAFRACISPAFDQHMTNTWLLVKCGKDWYAVDDRAWWQLQQAFERTAVRCN
jgi:hypothetical protein